MSKKILLYLAISAIFINLIAQDQDPVLMKINGRPILKSEFEYLYKKNNASNQQSLDQYLHLYTDYKLKVEEALSIKLDTAAGFIKEFNEYKSQASYPYLNDTVSEQTIAKILYRRGGENIEASHILIRLPEGVLLPADTLAAYSKAMDIRKKLFEKKAKSFEEIAFEFSEDTYAQKSQRAGYLGWATTGMFVLPFENAVYATKTDEVSMPVRSMFGYHLIKVHNRRPNSGKANISHIMFGFTERNPSDQQIDSLRQVALEVYSKLKAGGDYAQLCAEYSSDQQTSSRGGNLGWIEESTRLPQPFIDASFALKNVGDISEPIRTDFGFHILKLEDRADRDSWEASREKLVEQVKKTDWLNELTKLRIEKLGKEFNYKLNQDGYNSLISLANSNYPLDSLFLAKTATDSNILFTIGDKKYTITNFSEYISQNKGYRENLSTDLVRNLINNFILFQLSETQASLLENSYPEYRSLVQEYHDGILLFNVMNDEVWNKVANDSEALAAYFNNNKAKYNTWDSPRYKGYVIYCKDEATFKTAQKLAKKNKNSEDLISIIKSAVNNDSTSFVSIKKGLWKKGENKVVDYKIFKVNEQPAPLASFPYYFVTGKTISVPETYSDVKGQVISDLQEIREQEWMQYLRNKYQVEVDENVLKTIK